MNKALIVIDVQNDYFPNGKFPLWNTDAVLSKTLLVISKAIQFNIPVILIQQIAPAASPFFAQGTTGGQIHPKILSAAPNAILIPKTHADSFYKTDLEGKLHRLGATELLICGMMTQNCVTHTAISRSADPYSITVLEDCCTTVSEILHKFALNALAIRVKLATSDQAF